MSGPITLFCWVINTPIDQIFPVKVGHDVVWGNVKDAINHKHGAHSAESGFAIVKVDERRAVRIVGAIRIGHDGTISQDEDIIPTKVDMVPGRHWLKLSPSKPLLIGEYALVEILSTSDISQTVWDFRIDPQLGDNPGSIGPIMKK